MTIQVAIVTGAAGGFGSAMVEGLLGVGYHVAAVDIDGDRLEELAKQLGSPSTLKSYVMDVTDVDSVKGVGDSISAHVSSNITVLVNNAGVLDKNLCLVGDSTATAKKIIDINLTGAFNCTTVFAKYMSKIKYGRIINIASVAGIWGASCGSAYAASKAGLIKASESWARELGPLNICVTAIAPGICKTPMMDNFASTGSTRADTSAEENNVVKSIIPIGRIGTADDVSELVVFLATCKTNYLNSAVINLDGGSRVGTL